MEGKLGEESFERGGGTIQSGEVEGEEEEEHGEDDKNDDTKRAVRGDVVMTLDASVNDFVALVPGLDDVVNAINDGFSKLAKALSKHYAEYGSGNPKKSRREEDQKTNENERRTLYRGNGAPMSVVPKRVARF